IVAMSVYLARGIAETNKNLKIKLQEVAHLSEINREKDRKHAEFKLTSEKEKANAREANLRAEAAELKLQVQIAEKKALESEDRRKSEELEEARKLQLSMLPKKLPAVPGLNIAVYMDTATEVGGDYYDFYQKDNDELTLAIGDATGHGLKASTLVTAVKSLFPNLAQEDEIPSIFRAYTQTIKGMNLGILYMALTIAKFKAIETDNNANTKPLFTIDISSSGMPPVFLFRAAEKQTDSIILKGMPLGSVTNFPYQQKKYELFPNDVLLFMSDGFVELFDPNKKMIGLTNAKKVFTDVATQSPQEIIDHLTSFAAQWKKDLPAKDDITFVVVKIEAAK
ncbi:MAG TPA: SpoIIE family protein phosphatase, partial [Balneolales bacterium]|nr:SpoIIE family protein phosphatase [Balneolales bacterium]